jgi:hypothetical protein
MPRHASSHHRELAPTDRRRRAAAILALGVVRFRQAAAGGTDGESTPNQPPGPWGCLGNEALCVE